MASCDGQAGTESLTQPVAILEMACRQALLQALDLLSVNGPYMTLSSKKAFNGHVLILIVSQAQYDDTLPHHRCVWLYWLSSGGHAIGEGRGALLLLKQRCSEE